MPARPALRTPDGSAPHPTHRWPARLAWALALAGGLAAAGESRIELRDGSVITGELIGVGEGSYRVHSGTLGEISLREADVLAIRPAGAAPAPSPAPGPSLAPSETTAGGAQGFDLDAIRRQLVSQPQTMEAISRLQSDPDIQSTLSDPELVRRIMSGDLEGVRADPRFQRLLENPAIRDIVSQFLGR